MKKKLTEKQLISLKKWSHAFMYIYLITIMVCITLFINTSFDVVIGLVTVMCFISLIRNTYNYFWAKSELDE
jgi:hypothetical protein